MAESLQQKCLNCKKMGMIRCDGCNERFCSTHFNDHRHQLDILFEQICNDRDRLCEQINNPRTASSSTHPQLITILNEISEWESKTLNMVQKTADRARQQVNEFMNWNNTTAEVELDKLSKELRRRKEDDAYFEQDIEQLSKKLEEIQMSLNKNAPPVQISITPIDWSIVIKVSAEKFEKPKRQIINVQPNQLFIGGTLLSIDHQIQLNRFYGNENQNWRLVYKATKDGSYADICHRCCDNQGPTLTIIQSLEGYLFGGYAAANWDTKSAWKVDTTAFIFTLINPHNIPPTKYTVNSKGEKAILSGFVTGPVFGSWDLCICLSRADDDLNFSEFPSNYVDSTGKAMSTFTGSKFFTLTDLEIYRLA